MVYIKRLIGLLVLYAKQRGNLCWHNSNLFIGNVANGEKILEQQVRFGKTKELCSWIIDVKFEKWESEAFYKANEFGGFVDDIIYMIYKWKWKIEVDTEISDYTYTFKTIR